MNPKVLQAIEKYHMLEQGDSVVVGLSGGADSVALLDFLSLLRGGMGLALYACHINHCLRGEESDRDERFVRELCREKNIPLYTFIEDIPEAARQSGQSVETAARERRYARFAQLGESLHAKIATAHTLSDSCETLLFHLARGTGIKGLCGIPPVRGNIIRPLIFLSRVEIEEHCRERGLRYVTDSSNLCDDYTRNYIRHELIPRLERINPRMQQAFLGLMDTAREAQDYLEAESAALLDMAWDGSGWEVRRFAQAPPALQKESLSMLLRREKVSPSRERIEALAAALGEEKKCFTLSKDCRLHLERGRLFFEYSKARPETDFSCTVSPGDTIQKDGKQISFLCVDCEHFKFIENNEKILLKNLADYDKINGNVLLRTRRPGDRFSMPGRNWTKTLKKLFHEYGIPQKERGRLLVLADSAGVFWVEGFGVDRRVSPGSGTGRFLEIRMEKIENYDSKGCC